MSIEKTAQPDDTGHGRNSTINQQEQRSAPASQGNAPIDWQGLTPAADRAETAQADKPGQQPKSQHSPKPDARDDEKVEELAAPDWRSKQPMPSARNAVDPRGENTPAELFEQEPTKGQPRRKKRT